MVFISLSLWCLLWCPGKHEMRSIGENVEERGMEAGRNVLNQKEDKM